MDRKKISKMAVIIVGAAILVVAVYIMANGLGLSKELDFGAGAYYYADIPDFEKYTGDGAYKSNVPVWLCIILFLAWGWLMYKLWKKVS